MKKIILFLFPILMCDKIRAKNCINIKKNLILLTLIFFIVSCTKELSVAKLGKQVPDYTFKNILNSKEDKIAIRSLKGKIVILEFWATWCGPCIPAMKKLNSLQSEFGNKIEIITISSEKKERLEQFIKKTKTKLRLVSDTTHYATFKYKIIPHSIIIDENGIVRAITSPENINKKVLNNLIYNNQIDLELKDDFYIDPDLKVQVIKTVVNAAYRIELKGYNQEQRGGYRSLKDLEGNINGIELWNSTIPRLYQTLFGVASPSRIKFKDNLSKDDFPYEKAHQYNMTIEVSKEYQNKWKQVGIEFLNENFDVNAKMGIDTLACYVLKNIDNTIKESKAEKTMYMFRGPVLTTKKFRMSQLAEYLENFTSIPVLDITNLNGEYDIELEWQTEDRRTLDSELKKYGLKLEKSDKKLPVRVMEIYLKK